MSLSIIRPFVIYYVGKKVAEIRSGSYEIDSGDEPQIGTDGLLGYSDGTVITKIDTNLIVPVAGVSVTIVSDMLLKKYVSMGMFADGKSHQMTMRILKAKYDWDSQSGHALGAFSFGGGKPDLTG